MKKELTPEQLGKAKKSKSVGELLTLARKNEIEMTEAEVYYC